VEAPPFLQFQTQTTPKKGTRPMRKSFKAFAVASAILTGLTFASALHAHESQEPGNSMMGSNKMGQDSM
tara:strand:- start:440 stop:646 length:207 start_codon:yes stop_codon:yes gene_type:complete